MIHQSDRQAYHTGSQEENGFIHHDDVCQHRSGRPVDAVVDSKIVGGENSGSSFAGPLSRLEVVLPARSPAGSVPAFQSPVYSTSPLYLLYQKLLLPYRG